MPAERRHQPITRASTRRRGLAPVGCPDDQQVTTRHGGRDLSKSPIVSGPIEKPLQRRGGVAGARKVEDMEVERRLSHLEELSALEVHALGPLGTEVGGGYDREIGKMQSVRDRFSLGRRL